MARASALHAEGQRFDSVILHLKEHIDMMEAERTVHGVPVMEPRKWVGLGAREQTNKE